MIHEVKLFNTLSRQIEGLAPIDRSPTPMVALYCCGPTVYNFQHIGNLRTYIFEDVLARTLRYAGYGVKHVMNITDVGHLVSDADEGEDKMAVAVRREKKSSHEIAEYYTSVFFADCQKLNIRRPDMVCKATDHIAEMIQLIERLIQQDVAYVSGGNVYFEVSKFPRYGELARLDIENLKAGARIDVDDKKRSPLDFALWFTKSKFENQELQWDSPWGRGYPGWHIECSAMSMKYLGEHFDIHCGGIDHIPVHHTNEIAQSEGATGKRFANVWMHGGFLLLEAEKMSKSAGTFLTLERLIERGIDPLAYRLFCLGGNYRNELVFSWEALESAKNNLSKIQQAVFAYRSAEPHTKGLSPRGEELRKEFQGAMFNDLGMARALAAVHAVIGDKSLQNGEKLLLLREFDQVLGLGVDDWQEKIVEVPAHVKELAEARQRARQEKQWQEADRLRAEITAAGFVVEDTSGGPVLKPIRSL